VNTEGVFAQPEGDFSLCNEKVKCTLFTMCVCLVFISGILAIVVMHLWRTLYYEKTVKEQTHIEKLGVYRVIPSLVRHKDDMYTRIM
jgi:hypothetical protein